MPRDVTLIKPHSDECWDAYRKENESLQEKRDKKQCEDYEDIKSDINTINETLTSEFRKALMMGPTLGLSALAEEYDPHRALQLIGNARQKLRLAFLPNKNQRQELREELQRLWDYAIEQIEAQKKMRQERHEAWQEKQEIWRERTIAARDRKQERLDNQEVYRDRLQEQIDKLEDDIENARSETWAEKARGWLEEKYEKMRDVEQQIQQLKQEIADINEKLDNQNI